MNRRRLVEWLAIAGLAGAGGLSLAQPARVYRIGMLRPTVPPDPGDVLGRLFESSLRELGYDVGKNLLIEARYAHGEIARLPALARELEQARVDLIFAVGRASVEAARSVAPSLPTVFYGNFDAVASGVVADLAKPGGNATGVLIASEGTLAGKRLQLLLEAMPRVRRVALLAPDDLVGFRLQAQEIAKAATQLGVELTEVVVRGNDYERAFASIVAARAEALFVGAHQFAFRDRKRIIELTARHRLPATYEWPEQAEDGGFMAYGTSLHESYRSIARYIDRILKGASPGDLPVVQPTQFQLVINRSTARALGLAIPQPVLLRADRIIE